MALFIFAGVYQIIIAMWALNRNNIAQLFMLAIFSFAMIIYAGIQYNQIVDIADSVSDPHMLTPGQIKGFLIAIPCIIGIESILLLLFTWRLYYEYNDDIFKKLGPDKSVKRYLRHLLFFETIILFDFFFFVGFTLQFALIVLDTKDIEFGLTLAVIPVTAVVLIVVVICVYKEIKPIVYLFFLLCAAGLAYFVFKLVRIYKSTGRKHVLYLLTKKSLTVFAVITIVMLLVTIFFTIRVVMNFDKGIKDQTKLFRAHDEYRRPPDLGAPTDVPDNEMEELRAHRSPSTRSSRTLSPIRSLNSIESVNSGPNASYQFGTHSTLHPVYSEDDDDQSLYSTQTDLAKNVHHINGVSLVDVTYPARPSHANRLDNADPLQNMDLSSERAHLNPEPLPTGAHVPYNTTSETPQNCDANTRLLELAHPEPQIQKSPSSSFGPPGYNHIV